MIARVKFEVDGEPATAVLGDDRRWTCAASPATASLLNILFDATEDGPADGEPGWGKAAAAAGRLKGTVEYAPRREYPPGVDF